MRGEVGCARWKDVVSGEGVWPVQSWIWRQGVTCRVCRRVRVPCWRCWIGAYVRAADRVAIGCFVCEVVCGRSVREGVMCGAGL